MIGALSALWLVAASAGPACEQKCVLDSGKCFSACSNQSCTKKCETRLSSCNDVCERQQNAAQAARVEKASMPCGMTRDNQPIPCSAAQQRELKEAQKAKQKELDKAICKDASGEPVACPDMAAQIEKMLKEAPPLCIGPNGEDIPCPKKK